MPDLGEWKLSKKDSDDGELVAMAFAIIGDEGGETFDTTMPLDEARQFGYAILSLTGVK